MPAILVTLSVIQQEVSAASVVCGLPFPKQELDRMVKEHELEIVTFEYVTQGGFYEKIQSWKARAYVHSQTGWTLGIKLDSNDIVVGVYVGLISNSEKDHFNVGKLDFSTKCSVVVDVDSIAIFAGERNSKLSTPSAQKSDPQPANGKVSPSGNGEHPNNNRAAPSQPPEGPSPAKPDTTPQVPAPSPTK